MLFASEIEPLWIKWKQQHGRAYGNNAEETFRKNNFVRVYNSIKANNQDKRSTFKMGLNKFSDLSREEWKRKRASGYKKVERKNKKYMPNVLRST
jgi:hypothetical protein